MALGQALIAIGSSWQILVLSTAVAMPAAAGPWVVASSAIGVALVAFGGGMLAREGREARVLGG